MAKITISQIKIKHLPDNDADISWLGEFTDKLEAGVIVRQSMERDVDGRFIGKGEPVIPPLGREYRGFRPYASGEKAGTKLYYEYGIKDWKRAEGLERGDWGLIGIVAEATVIYPQGNSSYRLEQMSSSGLWGVESDSGEYLKEVERGELAELKDHLEVFGVDVSNFDDLAAKALEGVEEAA